MRAWERVGRVGDCYNRNNWDLNESLSHLTLCGQWWAAGRNGLGFASALTKFQRALFLGSV